MRTLIRTLLLVMLLAAPCLAQYKFTAVDYPGAANTNIYAVNNLGQYVGAFFDATGAPHAMYFNGVNLTALDPDGVVGQSGASYAFSLNNTGGIAGTYADSSGLFHGYVFRNGSVATLDFPGGSNTEAFGINDLGEVIGIYTDAAQNGHSFVLSHGVYTQGDLAGGVLTVPFSVNDRAEICGEFLTVAGTVGHGYLEQKSGKFVTYDAPDAPPNSTYFISINNRNHIVGQWLDASNVAHNFLLAGGKFQPFNLPASFQATVVSAQTINDSNEIVGWFADAQGVAHGFVAVRSGSGDTLDHK
jgi:uncharacterized membrane protein